MEDRIFYRLSDRTVIDLVPYLRAKLAETEGIRLYVGTDSQNLKRTTVYATVLVLHYGGVGAHGGGHVLFTKRVVSPRMKDRSERLWGEVDDSVGLANYLVAQGFDRPDEVHIDINPDPKYGSNSILRAALGYVEASGFKAVAKHQAGGSFAASYVADKLCQ